MIMDSQFACKHGRLSLQGRKERSRIMRLLPNKHEGLSFDCRDRRPRRSKPYNNWRTISQSTHSLPNTIKQVGSICCPTCFYILKKYSDLDIHNASYAMSKNFICVKFFGSTQVCHEGKLAVERSETCSAKERWTRPLTDLTYEAGFGRRGGS